MTNPSQQIMARRIPHLLSALLVAPLLTSSCNTGRPVMTQCTANYAVLYRDRVEFGHGEFSLAQSNSPHFFELKRDGQIAASGVVERGSLTSVGDSSPLLLTWKA